MFTVSKREMIIVMNKLSVVVYTSVIYHFNIPLFCNALSWSGQ